MADTTQITHSIKPQISKTHKDTLLTKRKKIKNQKKVKYNRPNRTTEKCTNNLAHYISHINLHYRSFYLIG